MIRKGMWTVLTISLLLLIPARTVQMLFGEQNNVWEWIGAGAFLVMSLVLLLLCRLDHRETMPFHPRSYPGAGVLALASAGAVLISSLYELVQLINGGRGTGGASTASDHPLLTALCVITGLMVFAVMTAWGVSLFRESRLFRDYPAVALILPIWACLILVLHFVSHTAEADAVQNFYSVLPCAFGLIFLFMQSRFFSDMGDHTARRRLYQYGAPFVLLGLGSSVPSLLCMMFGNSSHNSLPLPILAILLFFSLYALFCMAELRQDTCLLLDGEKSSPSVQKPEPDLSVTMELDRVVLEWEKMQKEKDESPDNRK